MPQTLTHITFGNSFDKKLENLPYFIKEIVLKSNYNKEYIKKIPLDTVITIGNKEYLYNLEYKNN